MTVVSLFKKLIGIRLGVLYQYEPIQPKFPLIGFVRANVSLLPKITLVTPSLNQGKYIDQCLSSVLNNAYPKLEYIIQDGGSSDITDNVIASFDNSLFKFFKENDAGQADALNKGFQKSSGEIMGWLNSDDILLKETLWIIADFFSKNPDVDVIYGNRIIIDSNGLEVGRWILPYHDRKVAYLTDYIPQETLFWRRTLWERVGGKLDDSFDYALDWDLILRFIDVDAKFYHLPELFGVFRLHGEQKTTSIFEKVGRYEVARLRKSRKTNFFNKITSLVHLVLYLLRHKLADSRYK
jgi:glycosyltransferase involved in cell wall biosynthesis